MDFFRGTLPLEKICRFLLNEKFSKVLKTKVTKDQLTLDVPSGTLTVTDIELNPAIFNNGRKSVFLRAAKIGNVQIHMAGKAAKSFFSDTVHDNLNVKVSDLWLEVDLFTGSDEYAANPSTDEEGIVDAVLAAIGASASASGNVEDSWSELERQMPSDSDGREQLSHIIKQFLLLAEFEVSGFSVVCNVFRCGRSYHPSQFRISVDSARLLNDFSHLKGKSMPSSSVEHLTHIVFGRQFRIGTISVDSRDCLANHCTAVSFEHQQWVPILTANLSPSSSLGAESDPFCKLQFQLKGFDSDLDISVLKIDICVDDVKIMLDFIHIQLFLSFAKIISSKSSVEDASAVSARRHCSDSGVTEKSKSFRAWFEKLDSVEDILTLRIKTISFLVACVDQPLRNQKRRAHDTDWLCTLQGVWIVAGPVAVHATSDIVLFQELLNDGGRNEIIRIETNKLAQRQLGGLSVKFNCDGSTDICVSNAFVQLDFDLLHRLNASFYCPVKSLQALFSKSPTSSSTLRFVATSVHFELRLSEDIIQHYHAQHSRGIMVASISQLSVVLRADQSFEVIFDDAELKLLPDFVIIRRLGSMPNTIKYKKESNHSRSPTFCMACDVVLRTVDVRLSIEMRQLIFALGTELASRLPHPPLDPPPLGKNFFCGGNIDDGSSQGESQSSDDEQFSGSPMGHESMLHSSIYVSAHSNFPLQESAIASQPIEPTLFPLYLMLMRNALHAMGASFSGQDSFAPEISDLVPHPSQVNSPLNYKFSVLVENFAIALAGISNPPDSIPCPISVEQPFYCSFNSSYKAKFSELDAVDALVMLSQRLEILVSVDSSASSTVSLLKFGSCQIIDSYNRVHVEPFYPFDGMLPSQSVSDDDRRENGQLVVHFESGGKFIDINISQMLLHYGHCNWIACIIQFFTEALSEVDDCNYQGQKNSQDVIMSLKFKLVAIQPALLPLPFVSPHRLFIEEACVSLRPGAEEFLKTISIESKALHFMVAPHVDHVLTCCNRLISGARNVHLNAVDRQHAPRHENIAMSNPDIARILRADCTLDWQRMPPLEYSAGCGFLCIASVPLLHLVQKSSPVGLVVELQDVELIVFTCADSIARILAKSVSDVDDPVVVDNPGTHPSEKTIDFEVSDEVVLSPDATLQLVEEEYRTASVHSALAADSGYLGEMYGKVRTALATHWSHLTGPGQVDHIRELPTTELHENMDADIAPVDESFFDVSSHSMFNPSVAVAPIKQQQVSMEEDSDKRDVPLENVLESFLAWRLELVNARVRIRIFAGCDFPDFVLSDDSSTPSGATSSFRSRDMDRSLELQIEGMHLRHSCFASASPISSRTSCKALDIKIADDVSDSFFRCLIQKDESYLECGAYERDAPVISFTFETLQKRILESHDYESMPRRFELHVLPLFCNLDERTLNVIWGLMHVYSIVAAENESSSSDNQLDLGDEGVLYQKFIINALTFRLNYRPILYPIMLRDSQVTLPSVKLWNCLSGQVLENTLKQWGGLQEIFRQFLGGVANSVPVLSNVAHIFSALNILVQQSIRNRSNSRQVRRNIFAFLSALSGEILDVGLIATRAADQLLSGASSVVVGGGTRDRQSRVSGSAGAARDMQMLRALQEDLKKLQQPANVQEGLQEALRSFSQGLECMMMTVLQPGRPSYFRRGAAAVLMPMQGMNRGVFQFLQGLMNQLQPKRRVRHDEKYKDAPGPQNQKK